MWINWLKIQMHNCFICIELNHLDLVQNQTGETTKEELILAGTMQKTITDHFKLTKPDFINTTDDDNTLRLSRSNRNSTQTNLRISAKREKGKGFQCYNHRDCRH